MTEIKLVELSERARLMAEIESEGIHIALPIECGPPTMLVSLGPQGGGRVSPWVPIHVVTMDVAGKWLSESAGVIGNAELVVGIVSRVGMLEMASTYAMTLAELVIVKAVGLSPVSRAIDRYAIVPGQWRRKLMAMREQPNGFLRNLYS